MCTPAAIEIINIVLTAISAGVTVLAIGALLWMGRQ
jgi:hypothetical protein